MYNGIGLQTARGSGTNGYIQTNKFFVRPRTVEKDARSGFEGEQGTAGISKKPNKDILEHDRKRQIHLKLVILEDKLLEQGYTDSEIADKLEEARKTLETSFNSEPSDGSARALVSSTEEKLSDTQSHQIAARKEKQMEILRGALGINALEPNEVEIGELVESKSGLKGGTRDRREHAFLDRDFSWKKQEDSTFIPSAVDKKKGTRKDHDGRKKTTRKEDELSSDTDSSMEFGRKGKQEHQKYKEKLIKGHDGRKKTTRKEEEHSSDTDSGMEIGRKGKQGYQKYKEKLTKGDSDFGDTQTNSMRKKVEKSIPRNPSDKSDHDISEKKKRRETSEKKAEDKIKQRPRGDTSMDDSGSDDYPDHKRSNRDGDIVKMTSGMKKSGHRVNRNRKHDSRYDDFELGGSGDSNNDESDSDVSRRNKMGKKHGASFSQLKRHDSGSDSSDSGDVDVDRRNKMGKKQGASFSQLKRHDSGSGSSDSGDSDSDQKGTVNAQRGKRKQKYHSDSASSDFGSSYDGDSDAEKRKKVNSQQIDQMRKYHPDSDSGSDGKDRKIKLKTNSEKSKNCHGNHPHGTDDSSSDSELPRKLNFRTDRRHDVERGLHELEKGINGSRVKRKHEIKDRNEFQANEESMSRKKSRRAQNDDDDSDSKCPPHWRKSSIKIKQEHNIGSEFQATEELGFGKREAVNLHSGLQAKRGSVVDHDNDRRPDHHDLMDRYQPERDDAVDLIYDREHRPSNNLKREVQSDVKPSKCSQVTGSKDRKYPIKDSRKYEVKQERSPTQIMTNNASAQRRHVKTEPESYDRRVGYGRSKNPSTGRQPMDNVKTEKDDIYRIESRNEKGSVSRRLEKKGDRFGRDDDHMSPIHSRDTEHKLHGKWHDEDYHSGDRKIYGSRHRSQK